MDKFIKILKDQYFKQSIKQTFQVNLKIEDLFNHKNISEKIDSFY